MRRMKKSERVRLEMHKQILPYFNKLMGHKYTRASITYYSDPARGDERMPLHWAKEGYSWIYADQLERWVKKRLRQKAKKKARR
jgi:hypothetical protein